MSNPFLGEISAFGLNYAPRFWMLCNGQTLAVQQFSALFSLLGTSFGGNGTSNFMIPNLQAQSPFGTGQGPGLSPYLLGEPVGVPSVTLNINQVPLHTHTLQTAIAAVASQKVGTPSAQAWLGGSGPGEAYVAQPPPPPPPLAPFSNLAITNSGGNQPHVNTQPQLVVNFCMAIYGVFPSRN
jgi:microcystin-dependent protein